MKPLEKNTLRTGILYWMAAMDWSFWHAARWLRRRQRRGMFF